MISLFAFSSNCCKSKYLYIFFQYMSTYRLCLCCRPLCFWKVTFNLVHFFLPWFFFIVSPSQLHWLVNGEWRCLLFQKSSSAFDSSLDVQEDVMFSSNAMTVKELEANLKPQFINLQLPGRFGRGAVVKRSARKFGFLSWSGQCCKSYLRVH